MDERTTDWRRPLLIAIVVVAAMFAAFTFTRNDATAAGQNPQSSQPSNQPIQSSTEGRDHDGHLCPDKGGRGRGDGGGEQGSAPAPQQSAPATPSTDL